MEPYVRPDIPTREFRDTDGGVIPYGQRWGMDSPPDDTYSVLTHPERFQPLHEVARALIAYLESAYDVTVSEDPAHRVDLFEGYVTATAAVRIAPTNSGAAPITLAFTSHPGLVLVAGALYVEPLPVCGCDACDETWETVADDLEWRVRAVVEGGFTERLTRGLRARVDHTLHRADGSRASGGGTPVDVPRERLKAARALLRPLDGGRWAAWSPREA